MTKNHDFYTPPPSSQGGSGHTNSQTNSLSSILSPMEQNHINPTSSAMTPSSGTASPSLSGASYENATRNTLFHKEGVSFGTTRYSAVFSENQASFGQAIGAATEDPTLRATFVSPKGPGFDMSNSQRELAIVTLLDFPTLRTCEILMENISSFHDVWISPMTIRQCLNQLWNDFGHCLGNDRSRDSVLDLANELIENSKTSLPHPDQGAGSDTSWINWFGGPRLRWEMIGILFTWAGMAFKHKQDWDPIFELPEQQGRNRNTSAEKMRVSAKACLQLCEDYSEINEVIVVLMKNFAKLHSQIISDESDRLRMHFGATGSAIITAGLHRQPFTREVTPLSQHRSILATSFFHLDKCDSLFLGRPPILDQRYCNIPQPLDLSEDDVYQGPERLAAAVRRLDANGWNTDKQIYTVTWLRAVSFLSPIREEILRLSLSANIQYTKPQIDALVVQLQQIVDSYPEHIQYRSLEQGSASVQTRAPHEIYMVTRIQLDVLQCAFLLQRLLVSRGLSNGQDLFNIAQEMISVVLSLWSDREQLRVYNFSFDWIILSYGIPCAGILCLELLRASNLAPPIPATEAMPIPTPVQLSRSEVVQTLTMFIAFLSWIRPTDNNVQLCGKFKKVVKRIIDTAIDAPRPSLIGPQRTPLPSQRLSETPQPQNMMQNQVQQTPLHSTEPHNSMDFMTDFDPAMIAMDDLDWLNTVDWTQGDWLELSQQNYLS
ncbi:hypothetical protein ACEPPN_013245 [Leptodophora sp. 'Broadleaf-Isolate-01']